ncbi:MAG: glucose-1-phosphate cytidylyltransferase [Candidatus Thorarchaeota archaeon]
MKTVILCGGKGTRIREVSDNIPKPMVPIGNYPILWHIMNLYAYYGYNDFVLCLGHLSWQIKNYFLNFKAKIGDFTLHLDKPWDIEYQNNLKMDCDWKITFAETGENAETGARIFKIQRYVKNDDHFMMTYGDGLSDVNIRELIKFHLSHGKVGTVTGVRPTGRFGEIEVGDHNQVLTFHEKPQTTGGRINGGFFVFDTKRISKYLADRESLNFERESLKQLAQDGNLMMFPHDGFWQPMDTYREYKLLNDLWKEGMMKGDVPWPGEKLG